MPGGRYRSEVLRNQLMEEQLRRSKMSGRSMAPANDETFFLRRKALLMPQIDGLGSMFGTQMGANPLAAKRNSEIANARQALGQNNFTVHGGGRPSGGFDAAEGRDIALERGELENDALRQNTRNNSRITDSGLKTDKRNRDLMSEAFQEWLRQRGRQ